VRMGTPQKLMISGKKKSEIPRTRKEERIPLRSIGRKKKKKKREIFLFPGGRKKGVGKGFCLTKEEGKCQWGWPPGLNDFMGSVQL